MAGLHPIHSLQRVIKYYNNRFFFQSITGRAQSTFTVRSRKQKRLLILFRAPFTQFTQLSPRRISLTRQHRRDPVISVKLAYVKSKNRTLKKGCNLVSLELVQFSSLVIFRDDYEDTEAPTHTRTYQTIIRITLSIVFRCRGPVTCILSRHKVYETRILPTKSQKVNAPPSSPPLTSSRPAHRPHRLTTKTHSRQVATHRPPHPAEIPVKITLPPSKQKRFLLV